MYAGIALGFLTLLRYSVSASLVGVLGWSLVRLPMQLRRRLCLVVLTSSVVVYSSMLVIFLGQCMPRIFFLPLL